MVRTKLVPKRINIRWWPPRERYTKYKIKTLLPEQRTVDIKKNGQVVRTVTVRRKTQKFTDRWARNFEIILAPNWEDHDAEKNLIVNYFADRQHTEFLLKKIEKKIIKTCFYCKNCENCTKLFEYNKVFKQQGFWSFNRHLKCWNVFDPDWFIKNRIFKLLPVREV